MDKLPKFVYRSSGTYKEPDTKIYNFKFHLKRNSQEGADTDNEAWCGFYPVGGNNGQLTLKEKFLKIPKDRQCSKCSDLYSYYKNKLKKPMPWRK